MKNPYYILAVSETDSDETIKMAYRKAATKAHPDREGGDEETFKLIQAAFDILSDPIKRSHFDITGDFEGAFNKKPSDELDNVKTRAIVTGMFKSYLNNTNIDLETMDVVDSMKRAARTTLRDLDASISANLKRIAKQERILQKLIRKNDGENILATIINSSISDLRKTVENDSTTINDHLKVIAYLDDYVHDVYGNYVPEVLKLN